MEEEEALEAGALVGQLPDLVKDEVHDLLADGVVTPSVVVGSVLLARDQLEIIKGFSLHVIHPIFSVDNRFQSTKIST